MNSKMDYSIIERESFTVVGIRRTTPYVAGTWGIVKKDINVITAEKLFGRFYDLGLCFGFGEDGSNDYMCAMEYSGEIPEGFDSFTYPAENWAKFEVKGSIKENAFGNAWKYINNEFLPQNKYEKSNPPIEKFILWDVDADEFNVEIWISFKKV